MTTADETRRRRAAATVERLLLEQAQPVAEALERDLPLSQAGMPAPTREARQLAMGMTRGAVASVASRLEAQPNRRERSTLGSDRDGAPVFYELPGDLPRGDEGVLLPLTTVFCTRMAVRAVHQLVGTKLGALNPEKPMLRAQMTMAILTEHDLWTRIAEYPRVPYPVAYEALRCLRQGEAKPGNASLCARCGCLLHARARGAPARRCPTCEKESPRAREWPSHAVMPHTKGEWYLACQAPMCKKVFIGPAQARHCPGCRLSRISPAKRGTRR